MRYPVFGSLLQLVGIVIVGLSMSLDYMMKGTHGYGKMQFAIAIVGVVIILTGLRETLGRNSVTWNRILLVVYTFGIMVMGLGTEMFKVDPSQPILGPNAFSLQDFFINMFGFVLLGYLLISNMSSGLHLKKTKIVVLAFAVGVFTSLFIETCQHFFVPGRFSSLYDIIGNGLGTVTGIGLYFLARKWDMHVAK